MNKRLVLALESLLLLPLLLSSPLAAAEPETILLWPEGAPGAVGDTEKDRPKLYLHRPETKSTATAVVVCPGGGYGGLAMSYEGHDVASWFGARGVTAAVLQYRLGSRYNHPAPLQDVRRAVRYLRSRATELGVASDRIGVLGFSAGGHLAASAATLFEEGDAEAVDPLKRVSSRPDFAVLAYPVITMKDPHTHAGSRRNLLGENPPAELVEKLSLETRVTPHTPPVFLFHTATDRPVPVENSLLFTAALRRAGVPVELHIYRSGPHGVGLDRHPSTAIWPRQLESWLRHLELLESKQD